jgi:uncharacterized repeat protein (TIGR03803 family)
VLHSFAFSDGANPYGGLIFDATGNLYGTTYYGGPNGAGVVFKLKPNADGSWTENVLYSFCAAFNCSDGANPSAGLIFDTAGNLYGTTQTGGFTSTACGRGCGVVFKLTPNTDGSWTESVLHSFTQVPDGSDPYAGLIFDPAGNLYGTTGYGGGTNNTGVVFELKPNADGSWTESVLYSFTGFSDGANPYGGLIFDATGNLYGTTYGGNPGAVVFKLKPNADGSWTESVLHSFPLNFDPTAGLIFDTAGNLYGTIYFGGPAGGGGIFKLAHNSNGSWAYRGLRFFFGNPAQNPYGGLVLDKAGNLYGTTYGCGNGCAGVVFEVTP